MTQPRDVAHWLLHWSRGLEAVQPAITAMGGTLFQQTPRRDGAWRVTFPEGVLPSSSRLEGFAHLEREVDVCRAKRPFSRLRAPELEGRYTRTIKVVDDTSGAALSDALVSLQGQSGFAYRGWTDATGLAELKTMEKELVRLEVLTRTAHWPLSQVGGISSRGGRTLTVALAPIQEPEAQYGWAFTRAMKIDQVHRQGIRGRGVRIAVLDTGVSPHPDLKISGGVNTADLEPVDRWQDTHWHGTHVAGVCTGLGLEGGPFGVAPEAELMAVRVGKVVGVDQFKFSNRMFETDLLEGLQWCIDNQIDVVNMSLFSRETPALNALLEEAYQRGVLLVAPSGNRRAQGDGWDEGGVDYPARHPRVIAVGALGRQAIYPANSFFQTAEEGALFSPSIRPYYVPGFSKSGQGLDFVAPGVAILSTVPVGLEGWAVDDRRLTGYTSWMGTSQAAPHVTGLIALILAHRADIRDLKDGRRAERIRDVLLKGSVSLGLDPVYQGAGVPMAPLCLEQVDGPV